MIEKHLIENLWQCIGRRDTYAIQTENGTYARINRHLTEQDLLDHLAGRKTIGTYLMRESGLCNFAVFDADGENGLSSLQTVAQQLTHDGVSLHLERSRRGGHGWIFFNQPYPATQIRTWLTPIAQAQHLELYPKQIPGTGKGVGSLIRVPLGIHRRSGIRYPFIDAHTLRAVAPNTVGILTWLPTATKSSCPDRPQIDLHQPYHTHHTIISSPPANSIREWCAAHDPLTTIGHYIQIGQHGEAHCPFGAHHSDGKDSHASFRVYQPGIPGGYCWYCHVWQQGGSLFDFLRYWYDLTPRDLWRKIKVGEI